MYLSVYVFVFVSVFAFAPFFVLALMQMLVTSNESPVFSGGQSLLFG